MFADKETENVTAES